jgi:hypothetical protein
LHFNNQKYYTGFFFGGIAILLLFSPGDSGKSPGENSVKVGAMNTLSHIILTNRKRTY